MRLQLATGPTFFSDLKVDLDSICVGGEDLFIPPLIAPLYRETYYGGGRKGGREGRGGGGGGA